MSRDLAELDPDVRALAEKLIVACSLVSVKIFVTQTYRTREEQDALYAQGRTTPGRVVTNARGGWSWHNWRRAFDVAIRDFPGDPLPDDVYNGPWARIGAIGEHLGLEWGGRWRHPDLPHFQHTCGRSLSALNAHAYQTDEPA